MAPDQCPYQVSTSYILWFLRYSLDKISNSRLLRQGQMSNQYQTMMLHTYPIQPMSLPSINILHFTVSEIQPRQVFPAPCLPIHSPTHLDTMGENSGVKICICRQTKVQKKIVSNMFAVFLSTF